MNQDRVTQLLAWLEEDAQDTFNLYALAMEYKEEMPEKAIDYLEKIRQVQVNYVATYYHLAELYRQTGNTSKAEEVYLAGIQICKEQKAQHALAELQNAYQNFLYED
ncbi:MAG: tetratricopeptide repeat protein [Thermoflexibacter sp.]|jgi:Tfp pilus assembly protein PilF|nr:tetratricopeptide repeat protein [Thermoflexibacter sp.]